jgi:hypothetical protein
MKKLNLKLKGIGEMLNKEQMKKIAGGGYDDCPPPSDCEPWESAYACFDPDCVGNARYFCATHQPFC